MFVNTEITRWRDTGISEQGFNMLEPGCEAAAPVLFLLPAHTIR